MYDSATDTALADQAWARATTAAAQRRTQLNTNYGLNADGSMDNSEAGHLGSLYQGNLGAVLQDHSAELADRRRGFGGAGGLGHKMTAAAEAAGSTRQALNFREANSALGANTQENDAANQQHTDDLSTISKKSAYDLAQTLAANPVNTPGDTAPTPGAPGRPGAPTMSPSNTQFSYAALYKSNPKKFKTIKGKF